MPGNVQKAENGFIELKRSGVGIILREEAHLDIANSRRLDLGFQSYLYRRARVDAPKPGYKDWNYGAPLRFGAIRNHLCDGSHAGQPIGEFRVGAGYSV